jgi:hypothetical protein
MTSTIREYKDNDCTKGLVNAKINNMAPSEYMRKMPKQVWKPKATVQWNEGYRAPLTIQ